MREFLRAVLFIVGCIVLAGNLNCSSTNAPPSTYAKDGLRLSLPGRCSVSKDESHGDAKQGRVVNIEGPGNAIFVILCVPATSPKSLEEFASSFAERRVSHIKEKLSIGGINAGSTTRGTSESAVARIQGAQREGIRQRFSITLLGTDVPHVAEFYLLPTPRYKVILITQAADEDLPAARECWQTIFNTIDIEEPR